MGNFAEAGGFGDTRAPSENGDDLQDYNAQHLRATLDPSMFTYRDGVNYLKIDREDLSTYSNWEEIPSVRYQSPRQN